MKPADPDFGTPTSLVLENRINKKKHFTITVIIFFIRVCEKCISFSSVIPYQRRHTESWSEPEHKRLHLAALTSGPMLTMQADPIRCLASSLSDSRACMLASSPLVRAKYVKCYKRSAINPLQLRRVFHHIFANILQFNSTIKLLWCYILKISGSAKDN